MLDGVDASPMPERRIEKAITKRGKLRDHDQNAGRDGENRQKTEGTDDPCRDGSVYLRIEQVGRKLLGIGKTRQDKEDGDGNKKSNHSMTKVRNMTLDTRP